MLILFMTHFYFTRVSVIVSVHSKSETSDWNKSCDKNICPSDIFLELLFSLWFMCPNNLCKPHLPKPFYFLKWTLLTAWVRCRLPAAYAVHFIYTLVIRSLFPQADFCDVKSNDKDSLAMPAASSQCKTSGQVFVSCCNQFGKGR